jgi:predicted CXXCH cytochrome family protein
MLWPRVLLAVATLAFLTSISLAQAPFVSPQPTYLGSQACQRCHQSSHDTWRKTLHVQMTKPIADARVEGDFGAPAAPGRSAVPVKFSQNGRAYSFENRDGHYVVTISRSGTDPGRSRDGAGTDPGRRRDGGTPRADTFEVHYTLGARRFQGYLSKLPDGRIYVLPVFWHNESKRWVDWKEITPIPDDPDHDLRQIWNVTCVNCHATNLVKNFNPATNTYATTWTEMGIGCEACHGPGAAHVAVTSEWEKNPAAKPEDPTPAQLQIFSQNQATPRQVFDTCGYCHGNKNNVFFGFKPGDRYEDYALPFLISQPIPDNDPQGDFWPDGRPSRFNRPQALTLTGCFRRGEATCTSCHRMHGSQNNHSLKVQIEAPDGGLTRQSDQLCTQCHTVGATRAGQAGQAGQASERQERPRPRFAGPPTRQPRWGGAAAEQSRGEASALVRAGGGAPAPLEKSQAGQLGQGSEGQERLRPRFAAATPIPDLSAHTHHGPDSQGSRCIACHMSEVNWRLITRRRDHTFQPPVPELTSRFGVPDACTTCHEDRPPEWAARILDDWYHNGERRRGIVAMSDIMYRAGTGDVSVLPGVARLAVDRSHGSLVRASAAEFAGQLIVRAGQAGQAGQASEGQERLRLRFAGPPTRQPRWGGDAAKQSRGEASASVRAGGGAPAPVEKSVSPTIMNALIGAAADPEAMVRITAVRALGLISDPRIPPVLAAHLTDEARLVRVSAAQALTAQGVVQLAGPPGEALTRALDEWAESLRTFNDVAADHTTLGWLEATRGRREEAEKELKTAIALDPADARPHVYLGVFAAREGRFQDAVKHFKAAKAITPGYMNLDRLLDEASGRGTKKH